MAETFKQEATRFLANVPEEFIFRCCTGRTLRNMKELGDELKNMSDDSYAFHVNAEKNDFTNWVRDIIKDQRLATELQKAPNRVQAARLASNRISALAKRLA